MAVNLQDLKIKVKGRLEERIVVTKDGKKTVYYEMKLEWYIAKGKRVRKSISTELQVKNNKTRAEDLLREIIREQEALLEQEVLLADKPSGGGMLFADLMLEWLKHAKTDKVKPIKPITWGGYQMNVETAIEPYFRKKGILLRDLTAEDIDDFYEHKLESLKATSVHKFHANISRALKYAVKKNYIQHSVMPKVTRPKAEDFICKPYNQSETLALFEAVKGHKLELAVILGAFYGLRRSEAVGLRWESIDFDANTITIEHSVTVGTLDGKTTIFADDTVKTKSSFRTLPLIPTIRAKLLAVKVEQEQNRKLCGKSYNKKEACYLYTDVLGNLIKPDYITDAFPKFLDKNGLRIIRFHDLRHSCASLLLANGVPLKQIQDWLGHSTFAITADLYAHLESTSKLASAQAMTWIEKTSLAQALDGVENAKEADSSKIFDNTDPKSDNTNSRKEKSHLT